MYPPGNSSDCIFFPWEKIYQPSKSPFGRNQGLGGESTAKAIQAGDFTDLCMKYSMGIGDNIFPDAAFQTKWERYFEAISNVSGRLLNVIGNTLGLDQHPNWQTMMEGDTLLRHLSYPDTPEERCADACATPQRMASHCDIDLITLLYQTPSPNNFVGLQAKIDDEYQDVPAIEGTFVVNFGEVLTFLTQGDVKATSHRVMAPPKSLRVGSSRTSTICFFQPQSDFPVTPFIPNNTATTETKPFSFWLNETLARFGSKNP